MQLNLPNPRDFVLKMKIFLFFLLTSSISFAQNSISGKVSDENGDAMPGVSVVVKGSSAGTQTAADGTYSVKSTNGTALIFSFLGYKKTEVAIGGKSVINVSLETDASNLDEVIVTALGIEKSAKSLTYAAQSLDGSKITKIRDANFATTLNGKVAGLMVNQASSGPGGAVRITFRGNRSLRGNNNALFVIDGVPVDNTVGGQVSSDFGGYNGSDAIANINPDDIDNMSFLKGASAAALYGSRAANGVVLITTKKGKVGKFTTSINSGVVQESPSFLPSFQNEYVQGAGGVSNPKSSGSWGAKGTTYPSNVADFFRNAISLNNSVSISGGSDKMQSYLSYTNNSNQGIVPTNNLMRHTLNLRLSNNISSKFSTDAKVTYVLQDLQNKVRSGEESGFYMNVLKIPRSVDIATAQNFEDENGVPLYWTSSSIYMNPYWSVNRIKTEEKRNRLTAMGSATYKLTNWLSLMGRVNIDKYVDRNLRSFYNRTLLFAGNGGTFQAFDTDIVERNLEVLLSGKNNLATNFGVSYNLGASVNNRKNQTIGATANGLTINNKFDLNFNRALVPISGLSERELQSVYGSANFSFKDAINLEVTARNDWSSTLPAPHSYFYPSVGANAILSDLISMPTVISFAKIRASYTRVGNDADPYLLTQTYSFGAGGANGFISRDSRKAIPDLKPELTTSMELGADFRFLANKLGWDFTYYKTNSINQLLELGLAPASGFSTQLINAGNVENRGFETTLNYKPISNAKFGWDATLNFSTNTNKIISLSPDIKKAALGGGFGRTSTPVAAEGGSYGDLETQLWQRDTQGRFVVDAKGKPVVTSTQQKVGNFNPKFMMGFLNDFTYKNFTARVQIDGRFGGVITSGTEANLAFDGNASYTSVNRDATWILDAVTATGEKNTVPISAETFWTTVSGGRYSWGEFFTYDATNVRLRELAIGYKFSKIPGNFVKNASISLVGRNLAFLYRGNAILDIPGVPKRKLSFDPDVSIGAGNFQGVEYGNLPSSKTFGVNLQLGF
jgi:TonB-linked SusC/RagA family outer membrane protein